MGKLVRDRIPEIIRKSGREPIVRVLGDQDFDKELRLKLIEESQEIVAARDDEVLAELADLWEVLNALAEHRGLSCVQIIEAAKLKAHERGAFSARYFID